MDLTFPDMVSTTIFVTGQWEPWITSYLRQHLRAGETFIDVGANIGYHTLLAAKLVGERGCVYSIEASKRIFERLKQNVALNGYGHVVCVNSAASDHEGELAMYMAGAANEGHSTTVQPLALAEGMTLEGKVPAATLSSLVGSDRLLNARLIKIDVEGAELAVLSPLFSDLSRFSDQTELLLELSPKFCPGGQDDIDIIFEMFTDAGFGVFSLPNSYARETLLARPQAAVPTRLHVPPTVQTDVLISRRFGRS